MGQALILWKTYFTSINLFLHLSYCLTTFLGKLLKSKWKNPFLRALLSRTMVSTIVYYKSSARFTEIKTQENAGGDSLPVTRLLKGLVVCLDKESLSGDTGAPWKENHPEPMKNSLTPK